LQREQEEQLCHLYDEALAYDKKILLLGRSFDLSKIERIDLKTRLQSSLHAKILPPDDILGGQLLLKLFTARQLEITPEIIDYIWKHCERSYIALHQITQKLDELSLKNGKKIGIALIKSILA
jgi:chromosomal replication initiation ATPase DnaA